MGEILDYLEPKTAILKVSKPIIIATFFEFLYSFVDSFWVSGLGKDALASIGASFPILITFFALAWGLDLAVSSAIARSVGEKNLKKAGRVIYNGIILGVIYSIIYIMLFYPTIDLIFKLMNVNLIHAINYSKILILGTLILNITDVFYGVFRGLGKGDVILKAVVVGSISNIILDPIFIYYLNLKVPGAALASVISIFFSLLYLTYALKHYKIKIYKKLDFHIVKDLVRVSIPSAMNDITVAVTFFILTTLIMIYGSDLDLAAFTGAIRITELGFIPILGLTSGAISVMGACYGAKRYDKLREAYYWTIKYGVMLEIFIFLIIYLFSPYLAEIFSYGDSNLKEPIANILKILSIYLLFIPFTFSTSSLFQSIGKGEGAFIIAILRESFHILSSYTLSLILGVVGIYLGWSIGDVFAGIVSLLIGIYTIKILVK